MQYIFNPVQYGFQEIARGIKDWFVFYSNLKMVREENLELLAQVSDLTAEVASLKDAAEENDLLREQLGVEIETESGRGLVIAQTLGNKQDKTNTSLILDKGSLHGISEGDLVIQGQFLIGIVRQVTSQRSVVELITSPALSIGVLDFETKTEGISKGQFGTFLRVGRVLPEEQVNIGDTFVTSGRDGVFPPGYIVGEVTEVSEQSAEELKEVDLKILVDFESLGKVFVVAGGASE